MHTEKALRRALLKQGYPSWGDLLTLLGVFIVATVLGSIIVGIPVSYTHLTLPTT